MQQPLAAASGSQTSCASRSKTGTGPNSRNELDHRQPCEPTYILWVSVDPPERHEALLNLALVDLNLILHGALVLFACLSGHDDCCDVQLAVDLFAGKDGTRLDLV